MMRILFLLLVSGCASTSATKVEPSSSSSSGADLRAEAKAQLQELTKAASAYEMQEGSCPHSVEQLVNQGLIQSIPNDPWGKPIAFMPANEENPSNAFVSGGPDGLLLTDDDIAFSVACSGR